MITLPGNSLNLGCASGLGAIPRRVGASDRDWPRGQAFIVNLGLQIRNTGWGRRGGPHRGVISRGKGTTESKSRHVGGTRRVCKRVPDDILGGRRVGGGGVLVDTWQKSAN